MKNSEKNLRRQWLIMDYDFKTRLASERQKVEEEFDYEGKNGGESRI